MLLQDIIGGSLQLDTVPSQTPLTAVEGTSYWVTGLIMAFILATLVFLPRFLSLAPLLFDSLFRARGSVSLESSVRYGHDRRLMAALLLIPAVLMMHRYRLYDAAFLRDCAPDLRLALIAGVFLSYLLLRYVIYRLASPRRGNDFYKLAHNTSYTFFILLVLLMLVTLGVLFLFHAPDDSVRRILYGETSLLYGAFLIRRTQILSLSCNHLRTFLYLCGLEILPSSALVISAVF